MSALIQLAAISKAFTIRHNKSHSFKSSIIGVFHKRYRETKEILWSLKGISLDVFEGESLGLIGRNGSGKSTLLRIIAGIYAPTSGLVHWQRSAKVGAMIELGVGFHPELTGKENVFLGASIHGLTRKEIEAVYPTVVEFSELTTFMDVPIKNYSSGMQARLGFSLAVNLNPDVLLIDEIFAVGDEQFQRKCLSRMEELRRLGRTIIFVSHDAQTINSFCDRVCLLDQGSVLFVGRPREGIGTYERLMAEGVE